MTHRTMSERSTSELCPAPRSDECQASNRSLHLYPYLPRGARAF